MKSFCKNINDMPARDKILFTAFQLFNESGIYGVSIDDILKKSNTGKSQFYHYFKNKEGVVRAILQSFRQALKDDDWFVSQDIKSWDDLDEWLGFTKHMQEDCDCKMACPIACMAANIRPDDELIRQDLNLLIEEWKEAPKLFFVAEKAKGNLREEADPEGMATTCCSVLLGASLLSKVECCTRPFDICMDSLTSYISVFRK